MFTTQVDPSADPKADFLQMVRDKAPPIPCDGPIRLVCTFHFPRPKKHYGTGRNAAVVKERYRNLWHSGRPDIDNLVKFVTDALNGIFYRDDAQITKVTAVKIWSHKGLTEVFLEQFTECGFMVRPGAGGDICG